MKSYTVWATFPFVARDGIKGKHMREGEQVTISVTYNGKVDDGQGELQLEGEE